jgi:hypothetical protein
MKKFELPLTLMVLLSMVGTSIAIDAVTSDQNFNPSHTGPTNVESASPFIAINVTESNDSKIGIMDAPNKGKYYIFELKISNHGYVQFPVDPSYFNVMDTNGGTKKFDPSTYFLGSMNIKPLANFTINDGQTINGGLAFRLDGNASPSGIEYNQPGGYVINWNVTEKIAQK